MPSALLLAGEWVALVALLCHPRYRALDETTRLQVVAVVWFACAMLQTI